MSFLGTIKFKNRLINKKGTYTFKSQEKDYQLLVTLKGNQKDQLENNHWGCKNGGAKWKDRKKEGEHGSIKKVKGKTVKS